MSDGLQKTGLKKGLKQLVGDGMYLVDNNKHYSVSAALSWTKCQPAQVVYLFLPKSKCMVLYVGKRCAIINFIQKMTNANEVVSSTRRTIFPKASFVFQFDVSCLEQ